MLISAAWVLLVLHGMAYAAALIAGALALRRARGRSTPRAAVSTDRRPSVSLIIAIHGVDPWSEQCLTSLLQQDYTGALDVVFSAQDPEEPSIELANRLAQASRSQTSARARSSSLCTNPIRTGYSAIASNFDYGVQASKGEIVILCTDDVIAEPDAVTHLVASLEHGAGLVSALPLFTGPPTLPARLYALFYNIAVLFSWAPSVELGIAAAWGGMVAMKRETIRAIGGLRCTRGFISEDLALARKFGAAHERCAVGPIIRSPVSAMSWPDLREFFARMAIVATRQNPFGAGRTGLLYALQYAYLLLLPAAVLSQRVEIAGIALLFYVLRGLYTAGAESLARGRFSFSAAFPVADALHAVALLRAPFSRSVRWSGVEYEIGSDGLILRS